VAGHLLRGLDGRKVTALRYDVELRARDGAVDLRRHSGRHQAVVLTVDDLGYSHRGGTLFLSYLRSREALAARVPGATLQSLGLSNLP